MRPGLISGVNVDRVDVAAGLKKAYDLGYKDRESQMVIDYALYRWSRGEEDGAEKTIISHRIGYTSWRVILAEAISSAEAAEER